MFTNSVLEYLGALSILGHQVILCVVLVIKNVFKENPILKF